MWSKTIFLFVLLVKETFLFFIFITLFIAVHFFLKPNHITLRFNYLYITPHFISKSLLLSSFKSIISTVFSWLWRSLEIYGYIYILTWLYNLCDLFIELTERITISKYKSSIRWEIFITIISKSPYLLKCLILFYCEILTKAFFDEFSFISFLILFLFLNLFFLLLLIIEFFILIAAYINLLLRLINLGLGI